MKPFNRSYIVLFTLILLAACNGTLPPPNGDPDPDPDPPGCTELSDDIDDNTTLSDCYRVTDDIDVDATLTIEPGTVIEFEQGTRLRIESDGELIAEGTEDEKITFTGTQSEPGWWQGVYIRRSDSVNNRIDHVIIEYGGRDGDYNLQLGSTSSLNAARTTITNSTLRHSDGYGLYVSRDSTISSFSENTLTENTSGAARASTRVAGFFDEDSDFTGNLDGNDHVFLEGGSGSDSINSDTTWENIGVPFRVDDTPDVEAELTIAAGATLEFTQNSGLRVEEDGALIAEGTEDDPVTFTGVEQDRGFWQGIYIRRSESFENRLDHVIVEYGGSESLGGNTANIVVGSSSSLNAGRIEITNSTLRHSDGYGLYVSRDSTISNFSENTLTENESGAARASTRVAGFFDEDSDFTGNLNGNDHVFLEGGSSSDSINSDTTWENIGVPFRVDDTPDVEAELTIAAGATLEFTQNSGLRVEEGGELIAVGTDDNPVTFTGAQQIGGFWQGIYIRRSESFENRLDHVIVEYGGSESLGGNTANIVVGSSSSLNAGRIEITNSTIRHAGDLGSGAGHGLWVSSDSSVNSDVCDVNTFSDNEDDDCVVN